jgi:hypothetical protein
MSQIKLSIDKIVLNGFAPGTDKSVVEGLQRELRRVLADPAAREAWAHSHRTPVLKLGSVPLENGPAGGRKFGAGIVRAIGKGLKT